jgi:SNF2 family DNA or RNA helicase
MTELPNFLSSYLAEADRALAQGNVKEIEFSGPTYQVLVEDPKTQSKIWVFLQLNERGLIKDAFCTCDESYESSSCVHLAIAYLSIYGSHSEPLNQRFYTSLWNQICRFFSDQLGRSLDLINKLTEGRYTCLLTEGKTAFSIQASSYETIFRLEQILEFRPRETEETSLKFSNLPQEEIARWRTGNPSPQLSYELSFWSDLAKWLFQKQEGGEDYKIAFTSGEDHLPHSLSATFSDMTITFSLPLAALHAIIPALNTVKSPLCVYEADLDALIQISYDKKTGCLNIQGKEQEKEQTSLGYILEGWRFVPGDGFYAQKPHGLIANPTICGADLGSFLDEHAQLVAKYLIGDTLHIESVRPSYDLFFDSAWDLHIQTYLFKTGDLSKAVSRFNHWVYLEGRGFYRLEPMRFDEVETAIPSDQVSEFITRNRSWLNTQEGFQAHLASVDCPIVYKLSAHNRLTFSRDVSVDQKDVRSKDFGSWVYWQERGFYPKATMHHSSLLQADLSLNANQIPLFIRMNREELTLVHGFFSEHCPILRGGLKITLNANGIIHILPEYELVPEYRHKKVRFFDDVVYVEGEGFHSLPVEAHLPEQYHNAIDLEGVERDHFLTFELAELEPYILQQDSRLAKPHNVELFLSTIISSEKKGKGWYQLDLWYQTERGSISIHDLYGAMKQKKSFLFDPAGLIDLRDKRFDWIRHLKKDQLIPETQSLFLSSLEFMRLNALEPMTFVPTADEKGIDSRKIFDELTNLTTPAEPNVTGLLSDLRPYQKLGVRWLWFLYRQHLSGLLCDDMGLGKTHQTMGLMAGISNFFKKVSPDISPHFLVVCPTSVIYHWKEKLEHFLPHMRICIFYGSKRSLKEFHEQYDILITSYGILRIETDLLASIPFELAVFDEIQLAKNQLSRIYASLLKIKAQMRLGLTGTPIENRLRELKTLFDVVAPHYMPNETDYKQLFIKPIEKDNDAKRKSLLSRFIKPFVLRRKKEEVLFDLPEKTEEITICELLPLQQELYLQVLSQQRTFLVQELEDEGKSIPFLHIFALLSSLKQICNHPAMYLKDPLDYRSYESGKWESFVELLMEARESQQKVVVFSQYLGMLDIIEAYLTENDIGFAAVRGSTLRRHEQIDRFNQDPSCEVFVGSLQAVGLGIDLTAGSVVIHYDRWWNAARENQATDRVHRIGQKRGVQVFKLVTKGTFEEKIDQMIAKKGQLMEDVIGIDDANTLKSLTRQDLIELLGLDYPKNDSSR